MSVHKRRLAVCFLGTADGRKSAVKSDGIALDLLKNGSKLLFEVWIFSLLDHLFDLLFHHFMSIRSSECTTTEIIRSGANVRVIRIRSVLSDPFKGCWMSFAKRFARIRFELRFLLFTPNIFFDGDLDTPVIGLFDEDFLLAI